MAHFQDLAPCTYSSRFFTEAPLAIGWLDTDDYLRGEVSETRIRKLVAIHEDSPFRSDLHYRGMHPCPFCDLHGEIETNYGSFHIGARNILVPGADVLYYAPSTILHYILDHGYQPPDVFLEAVDAVDLDNLDFIDQVARTLILDDDRYAERVGALFATQRGLATAFEISTLRSRLTEAETGRRSWPPQDLTEEAAARIAAHLVPARDMTQAAFTEAMEMHRGTKWFPALSAYAESYQRVQPPAASSVS